MAHWYTSIKRLGLKGIIFHDELTDSFVKKYTTENISFEKTFLGDLSTNDERFFIYYEYLKNNKYENVFLTDLSDVWFKKDPFEIIDDKYKLWVGSEQEKIDEKKWIVRRFEKIYGKLFAEMMKGILYNAGIIGGSYSNIFKFLGAMTNQMNNLKANKKDILEKYHDISFNMAAFNKVLYKQYNKSEIFTGEPLHSPFKSYLKGGDYYIFHK
jgi:hypothetical protein